MEAPTSSGKVAIITDARRQLSVNAIPNAVIVSATFCTIVDRRSASALLTNVASAANFDKREPVLFSSKSNHPTSLERIAANRSKNQELSMTNNYVREYENVFFMFSPNWILFCKTSKTNFRKLSTKQVCEIATKSFLAFSFPRKSKIQQIQNLREIGKEPENIDKRTRVVRCSPLR